MLQTQVRSAELDRALPPIKRESRALRFILSQTLAIAWSATGIWISSPWIRQLESTLSLLHIGHMAALVTALLIVGGIAYVPGYMVSFMVFSLVFHSPPDFKVLYPTEPITILIAAHNEEESMHSTLEAIAKQDYRGPIKVIVIDNNSTDNTALKAIQSGVELGLDIQCIREPNPGKHNALNTALKFVDTELVITLDADTIVHDFAIRHLVCRMLSAPDRTCAVAGSLYVSNSKDSIWSRMQYWEYFLSIASIKWMQSIYQHVLVAQGAFSVYRTSVIKEVGGWPDAIGEDIVLTWKFFRRGFKVLFEPTAIAKTDVPVTLKHLIRQRIRWARGLIEALRYSKTSEQKSYYFKKYLISFDVLIPCVDIVLAFSYTLFLIPGTVLAIFGLHIIVGWTTLIMVPVSLVIYLLLFMKQHEVYTSMNVPYSKNILALMTYLVLFQTIMSPVAVYGYIQQWFNTKRVWK
jgi:biofilm PGA synthesis N-glycosyltransferase PgaC